jgi:hypothetical protein
MHDDISSKLIANQWVLHVDIGTPRDKYQNFHKNDPKYWYYANNFTIWTIIGSKTTILISLTYCYMILHLYISISLVIVKRDSLIKIVCSLFTKCLFWPKRSE